MSAKPLFPLLALVLVGVSLHGPARAGVISVPSPANCSKPSRIVLTGETLSGAPDPYGEFSVTVRDLANLAVTGSLVIVDFTDAPSVKVPTDQSDPAIQWQHCSPALYGKFTPTNGTVTFRLAGLPSATCQSTATVHIYADGVLIASPSVATLDLDGTGGVTATDLSRWLELYFAGTHCAVADFDGSGDLGAADLGSWLEFYFHHSSTTSSPAPYCQ